MRRGATGNRRPCARPHDVEPLPPGHGEIVGAAKIILQPIVRCEIHRADAIQSLPSNTAQIVPIHLKTDMRAIEGH